MTSISAVIIAKNEAFRIEQCLRKLSWCNEIVVVVDQSTTDNTSEVCQKYTSLVYEHPWMGYGAQKNYAISKATSEWILSIDADEIVPEPLSQEILKVIMNLAYNGYEINFETYVGNKQIRYGGMQNDWHLRLFKKNCGVFTGSFGGEVHELVEINPHGRLINHIQHYSYADWVDYKNKVLKYSEIEAGFYSSTDQYLSWKESLRPFIRFIKIYFFQKGFLDGIVGVRHAYLLSYYVWKRNRLILDMIKRK